MILDEKQTNFFTQHFKACFGNIKILDVFLLQLSLQTRNGVCTQNEVSSACLGFSTGTITCLKFHGNRHLISGAEDGLVCVWDAKKWECLKSIKAHK